MRRVSLGEDPQEIAHPTNQEVSQSGATAQQPQIWARSLAYLIARKGEISTSMGARQLDEAPPAQLLVDSRLRGPAVTQPDQTRTRHDRLVRYVPPNPIPRPPSTTPTRRLPR